MSFLHSLLLQCNLLFLNTIKSQTDLIIFPLHPEISDKLSTRVNLCVIVLQL